MRDEKEIVCSFKKAMPKRALVLQGLFFLWEGLLLYLLSS